MTKEGTKWKWNEKEQTAFDELKAAISTKCFAYFNKDWETRVAVDASPVGLGVVLKQVNPANKDETTMVVCGSRALTEVERRYSQCEKEALAAVWGCERLWLYLIGRPFILETDNRAIQILFANTKSKPPARIERLALRVSQFDFTIEHHPGKGNVADYYSRHPIKETPASAFLEEVKAE